VGALCRFAHASGRHPASSTVAGITGTYRLLIYHLIASSVHHQSRHKPSIFHSRFPSHLHILPCTQRWQGSSPVPRSRQKRDGTFSSPPPIPLLISSLCSGPVCGRAWVSRLLPTSGHVAHGSVSSIDETRLPRVSSNIARSSRLHVCRVTRQTRVTVTHTSVPSPISMRGAATGAFASSTERELTGSVSNDSCEPFFFSRNAQDLTHGIEARPPTGPSFDDADCHSPPRRAPQRHV